ncbi:hypothetical protein ACSBR2_006295 [Camellia fascicularis]
MKTPLINCLRTNLEWGERWRFEVDMRIKFDGKVTVYPGYESRGSMDLEVCLLPESVRDLEFDGEFMDAVCI